LIILKQTLQSWSTDAFESTLKAELMALEPDFLPLQEGVSQGGYVDASNIELSLLSAIDNGIEIAAKVGVFFSEIIAGCSCGDDPATENAYCELTVYIDKQRGYTRFELA